MTKNFPNKVITRNKMDVWKKENKTSKTKITIEYFNTERIQKKLQELELKVFTYNTNIQKSTQFLHLTINTRKLIF